MKVIAFGGDSTISKFIKLVTRYPVSHVALLLDDDLLVESTSLSGGKGVSFKSYSAKLDNYTGDIWELRVSEQFINAGNEAKLREFLYKSDGLPYPTSKAVKSVLDLLDSIGITDAAKSKAQGYFCTELILKAFIEGGYLPDKFLYSELTPADFIMLDIYEDYTCITNGKQLPHFSSVDVNQWVDNENKKPR